VALSTEQSALVTKLNMQLDALGRDDERLGKYYEGSQLLEHIGLAVPPELRKFETVINWSRVAVDSVEQRLRVKDFILPGENVSSGVLREHWDANNLDSESALLHKDTLIYGRGFVCVGSNAEDKDHPLITVESPREMTAVVDPRTRRISSALRVYGGTKEDPTPKYATLYEANSTVWLEKQQGSWVETERDDHNLGRVPIVMFLNRRRTGDWLGVSEMKDVIPLVDSAARAVTNLQIALETHAVPQKWVLGMSKGDFVDADGAPIPAWQSYYSAIWANQNKDASVGQFSASDLKNFHDTINHYGQMVSSVTGLPTRYLGQTSVNPAAEGAIRADESRLVLNAEGKASNWGDGWAWVQGIAERFRSGAWPMANQIKTEWYDAGTPTFAQKADALTKLYANGQGVIARESVQDEMGWSQAKKDRDRAYREAEQQDPYLARLDAKGTVNVAAVAGGGA
jgi:Phage portal protein, SPP1 Gp6-like